MIVFLIRRILSSIPTLFGVAVIVFALFHLVGGDPTYQMVGKNASAQTIAEIRHEYGFDLPVHQQFIRHLKEILTLDFPRSYATKQDIWTMISNGIVPSIALTLPSFVLTTILSLGIALLVAYYRGRLVDRLVMIACVFGMSVSVLAYILFGQYYLAYKLQLFPITGFESTFPDLISYVALPVLISVAVSVGFDTRFYRTAILEETQQDYVRTARAKGLTESRIYLKHVLKNSMIPVLTNIVTMVPLLILGSFLLEGFFGIPGLGGITIVAINASDFPVIKVMTMLQAVLYIVARIFVDVTYRFVDPRMKF